MSAIAAFPFVTQGAVHGGKQQTKSTRLTADLPSIALLKIYIKRYVLWNSGDADFRSQLKR